MGMSDRNAVERAETNLAATEALKRLVRSGIITVNEAARRLKVNPETVRVWLRGDALPSGRRVDDLAHLVASLAADRKG